MSRRRTLVAWDVSDPRRLRAVRRCAEDFGNPLQKSVFICDLRRDERERFLRRLNKILRPSEDQVVFIDLGPEDRDPATWLETLGRSPELPERVRVI